MTNQVSENFNPQALSGVSNTFGGGNICCRQCEGPDHPRQRIVGAAILSKLRFVISLVLALTTIAMAATSNSHETQAATVVYNSRTSFSLANPGLLVEGFEQIQRTFGSFNGPLDASTSNLVIRPGDILPGVTFEAVANNPNNSPSTDDLNIISEKPGNKTLFASETPGGMGIYFTPNITAFGVDIYNHFRDGQIDVTVNFVNGLSELLMIVVGNDALAPDFLGIASSIPISSIFLISGGANEVIDNVAFGEATVVPLPAAFPLLGGALSLLGFFGWRRKWKG